MVRSEAVDVVSQVLGWIYFTAWSVSFYPQVILNHKRKSVVGLSLEYQLYNVEGNTFYAVYNIVMFIVQRNTDGVDNSVKVNDLVFSIHAAILTYITAWQCIVYFQRKKQKLERFHLGVTLITTLLAFYNILLALTGYLAWYNPHSKSFDMSAVGFMGEVKVLVTFIKYVPQVLLNYTRKSTEGWSIENVLLDLTGGVCSFAQIFLDGWNKQDWGSLTDNIPKLVLGLESVFFDTFMILQHYVLYNPRFSRARRLRLNYTRLLEQGDSNSDSTASPQTDYGTITHSSPPDPTDEASETPLLQKFDS